MCLLSNMCVCFDRCEDWSLKIQTRKKSLYSFQRIHTNIQFPHWLGKELFWQLLIKLRQTWPGCCSPSVRPISSIKLKPTAKIKRDSLSVNVSVGPYPIRNCFRILQVFFFSFLYVILLTFCMMYTVLFWLYKILCSHSMRWLEVRLWNIWWVDGKTRYGLGWYEPWHQSENCCYNIIWGEGKTWRVKVKMGLMGCWGEKG